MQVRKQQLELDMEQQTGSKEEDEYILPKRKITDVLLFQRGRGVRQGCILSPCLFNLHAEYVMRNTGLEEAQAGIKIARREITITSDMQITPPLQ